MATKTSTILAIAVCNQVAFIKECLITICPTLSKNLYPINADIFDRFIAIVETGEPLEADFYYPLGESCWYHYVAVKLGNGFAITIRDITARKKWNWSCNKRIVNCNY
jgi:hypothetical protein